MPVPRAVGKLNRVGFNHLTRPILRHLPGFAVVHHRGRTSGREFQTPVMLFRTDGGFVIALVYGPHTDWVENVLATGACSLETKGRLVRCDHPRLYRDRAGADVPRHVRVALRALGVDEFLQLSRAV